MTATMAATDLPRILCVDDEPLMLRSLARRLKGRYRVHTAPDGAAALAALERDGPFAVILSDLHMPRMDGVELLRRASERAPETMRILLTGCSDFAAAVAAVNAGHVFRFLTKPCPRDVLLEALEAAVRRHRAHFAERAGLERRLKEVSDQLAHAERLATLGAMAGAVGHELANVASMFLGALAVLRRQTQAGRLPEETDLRRFARIGEHLRTHSAHLLAFGRPAPEQEREFDLRESVTAALAMLRLAGRTRDVEIAADLPDRPVLVRANPTRIEQVVLNLVANAADALGEVEGRPGAIRVTVREDRPLRRVTCRVDDTGCGIAPDKLKSIFEPYYTTKPPERGTGLGLPVVKQIVESYGGAIGVESRPGEGSSFTVDLPL